MAESPEEQREFSISRRLKAPRPLVWRTFEDPHLLAQWWGPENFSSTITKLDFRPGGAWHVVMLGPDGTERPVRYRFIEIVAPERIVYRPDPLPGRRGPSLPTYVATLTFAALGNETVFTMRARFESAADLAFAFEGGFHAGTNEAYDKLERQLASSAGGSWC